MGGRWEITIAEGRLISLREKVASFVSECSVAVVFRLFTVGYFVFGFL